MNGNWDDDGDGIYGEKPSDSIAEESDLYAEVYVGQIRQPPAVGVVLERPGLLPQTAKGELLFDACLVHGLAERFPGTFFAKFGRLLENLRRRVGAKDGTRVDVV